MEQGIEVTPERVLVSSRAHLILPYSPLRWTIPAKNGSATKRWARHCAASACYEDKEVAAASA